MKTPILYPFTRPTVRALLAGLAIATLGAGVQADETCTSPYARKITGQEDFVYVWTLGVQGLGDEQDKLVTVDVNPSSKHYGKVVASLSVGGRNEAHHSDFTDVAVFSGPADWTPARSSSSMSIPIRPSPSWSRPSPALSPTAAAWWDPTVCMPCRGA